MCTQRHLFLKSLSPRITTKSKKDNKKSYLSKKPSRIFVYNIKRKYLVTEMNNEFVLAVASNVFSVCSKLQNVYFP